MEGIDDRSYEYETDKDATTREEELMETQGEEGGKFTDAEFRPIAKSLYFVPDQPIFGGFPQQMIRWSRISANEIRGCTDSKSLEADTTPSPIVQGALPNNWFLSALALLTMSPHLIRNLIVSDAHRARGLYTVKFFKEGKWKYVHVDDLIPCTKNGTPYYSKNKDPCEAWCMVIEKAYAKLHGTYEALANGTIEDGLKDLTGSPSKTVRFRDYQLWTHCKEFIEDGSLLGCISSCDDLDDRTITEMNNGIMKGKLYALKSFREIDAPADVNRDALDLRMVQLHNPWGEAEWNGDWCCGSKFWDQYPSVAETLGYHPEEARSFWMTFDDFLLEYDKVFVSLNLPPKPSKAIYTGSWLPGDTRSGSGGTMASPGFFNNPQYTLSLDNSMKIHVQVSQPDVRLREGRYRPYLNSLGFYVIKLNGNAPRASKIEKENVKYDTTRFSNKRTCYESVSLLPGRYAIIPVTRKQLDSKLSYLVEIAGGEGVQYEQEGDVVAEREIDDDTEMIAPELKKSSACFESDEAAPEDRAGPYKLIMDEIGSLSEQVCALKTKLARSEPKRDDTGPSATFQAEAAQ